MNTKRGISLLIIVASLSLLAGACSSDSDSAEKKSAKSTTTAPENKGDKSGDKSTDEAANETTSTVSNEAFSTALNKVNTAIGDAGTDPCKLLNALSAEPPSPGNSSQAKQLVDTYALLLRAVGGAIAGTSPANADVLKDASAKILKVGEDKKFAVDLFESKEFSAVMNATDVTTALSDFTAATQSCQPATTTPQG